MLLALCAGPADARQTAAQHKAIDLNNRALELADAGDMEAAVKAYRDALKHNPEDTVIKRNFAFTLNNIAVALIDSNPLAALGLLAQAAQLTDTGPVARNMAGAHVRLGQMKATAGELDQARDHFLQAMRYNPKDAVAMAELGRIYYDQGDLQEADRMLKQARKIDPDDTLVKTFMAKVQKERGEEEFYARRETIHFRISAEPSIDQGQIYTVARALEDGHQDLHRLFRVEPKNKIAVVLYPSGEVLRDIHSKSINVQALYDGKIRLPVNKGADKEFMTHLIRHELAHAYFAEVGADDIPYWLNEGLAEWVADPKRATPALARAVRNRDPLIQLDDLDAAIKNTRNGTLSALAYDQSFAFVKHLGATRGEASLARLVGELRKGLGVSAAFRIAFNTPHDVLYDLWLTSTRSGL